MPIFSAAQRFTGDAQNDPNHGAKKTFQIIYIDGSDGLILNSAMVRRF